MMSIVYVFWMYVILFAVIGAMRGWVKELLVVFSVILALTTNHVLKKYIPLVSGLPNESTSLFWIRALVVITLVYFGYQTVVSIQRLAAGQPVNASKIHYSVFSWAVSMARLNRRNNTLLPARSQLPIC